MSSLVSSAFTYGRNGGEPGFVANWASQVEVTAPSGDRDLPSPGSGDDPGLAFVGGHRPPSAAFPERGGESASSRASTARESRASRRRPSVSTNVFDILGGAVADRADRRSARSVRVPPGRQASVAAVGDVVDGMAYLGILPEPSASTGRARRRSTSTVNPRSVSTLPVYPPDGPPPAYQRVAEDAQPTALGEAYLAARPASSATESLPRRQSHGSSRAHEQFTHELTLSEESMDRIADKVFVRNVGLVVGVRRQLGIVPEEVATGASNRRRPKGWVRKPLASRLETAARAYVHGPENVSYRKL